MNTTITATFNPSAKTKWTTSHRKENKCHFSALLIVDLDNPSRWNDGRVSTPIEARLYGTGSKNYACLYVNVPAFDTRPETYTQGSGSAGGYGYHRPSAALGEAITNAGFTLSRCISGAGESAMREAMLAVALAAGIKNPGLIETHP